MQVSAQVTPGPREKQPSWDTTNVPGETISKHYDSLISECQNNLRKLNKYILIIQQEINDQQKQLKYLVDEVNKNERSAKSLSKSETEKIEKKIWAINIQIESLKNALKIKLEQVETEQRKIRELEKEKQELLRKF